MADYGYSVERAKSGLSASQALIVGGTDRRFWTKMEAFWKEQLKHAEKRECKSGS